MKKEEGSYLIHPYYDEKIIIITSNPWLSLSKNNKQAVFIYSIINMINPEKEISKVTSDGLEKYYFSYFPNEWKFLGYRKESTDHDVSILSWLNLDTFEIESTPRDYLNHLKVSGYTGGITDGGEGILLSMKDYGKIYLSVGKPYSYKLNWEIPRDLVSQESALPLLIIDNDQMRVLYIYKENQGNDENPGKKENHYLIFNKLNNNWYSEDFIGPIRAFGPWIAGYVIYPNEDQKTVPGEFLRYQDDRDKFYDSRESGEYGYSFDAIVREENLYAPGIIYLYNIYYQEKIEMNTGQGDSEILLVEGNTLYYRIFDEIYQAEIIENDFKPKTERDHEVFETMPFYFIRNKKLLIKPESVKRNA